MVNKYAASKCNSGYASNEKKNQKKQIGKFHFPLKNAELNKQWTRFVNRRDWLAVKYSVLRECYFEGKYLWRFEKCPLKVVDESCTHRLSSKTFK